MCWLIRVTNWLNIPLVVTAEDIPHMGNISEEVTQVLPPNIQIYNKMSFGLAAQADILEAILQTNRKTAVLIGYETDLCVTHSALGLMKLGYIVAVGPIRPGRQGPAIRFSWIGFTARAGLLSARRVYTTNGSAQLKSQSHLNPLESMRLRDSYYEK